MAARSCLLPFSLHLTSSPLLEPLSLCLVLQWLSSHYWCSSECSITYPIANNDELWPQPCSQALLPLAFISCSRKSGRGTIQAMKADGHESLGDEGIDQFSWWWCVHHTFYRELRKRDVSKFHIQLCIALLCMLLVFVSGIDQTQIYGGCVTVSALLHYFTLVIWMWMGAEAVFMFQKLVIVFSQTTTRYIIAVSLVCWRKFHRSWVYCTPVTTSKPLLVVLCTSITAVVPIVPVVIPLAIDRDFMVTFSPSTINGANDSNNATDMRTIR